jgi:hypothetical protein
MGSDYKIVKGAGLGCMKSNSKRGMTEGGNLSIDGIESRTEVDDQSKRFLNEPGSEFLVQDSKRRQIGFTINNDLVRIPQRLCQIYRFGQKKGKTGVLKYVFEPVDVCHHIVDQGLFSGQTYQNTISLSKLMTNGYPAFFC